MNREVSVTKRVKTENGLRYCPVVLTANGRIRPDYVLVNNEQERHTEGSYYISWYTGKKLNRVSVGNDAATATNRRAQKEAELNAINSGVVIVPSDGEGRISLSTAIADYLEEIKLTKKPKTLLAYTKSLEYFSESCSRVYVEDIERKNLLQFSAFLRDEKEQALRTVRNNFMNVVIFLKWAGVQNFLKKGDFPTYVSEEPEVYDDDELDTVLAACDDDERLLFEFLLMTGMRDQEVQHVYWSDVNFNHSTVRVTHKPDRGWTPKAYREREIPIPAYLTQRLRTARPKGAGNTLIFSTPTGDVRTHLLRELKDVARRAELNEDNFWLHKFRATFATRCLWAGVDLRTVQQWLGHKDMESTLRYLKPARNKSVRDKVNDIFNGIGASR